MSISQATGSLATNKKNSISVRKMNGFNGFLSEFRKNKILFFMAVPSLLYFIIMRYIPLSGMVLAFKNYNFKDGIFNSPWAGLKNFQLMLSFGNLGAIVRNTILYNISWIIINIMFQVAVAILISEMAGKYFKKFCQSAMLLPYFISFVILGAFVYNLFNYEFGSVNTFLKSAGMEAVDVYGDRPWAWIFILTGANIWKSLGYGTVLYLAAIVGIDREFYESAIVDGASIFKQIFYITLPLLRYIITITTLLAVGNIFYGQFDLIYNLTGDNGQLYQYTDVIDTFVFRSVVRNADFSIGAAIGFLQSLFGFISVIAVNGFVRVIDRENSLF